MSAEDRERPEEIGSGQRKGGLGRKSTADGDKPNQISKDPYFRSVVRGKKKDSKTIEEGEIPLLLPSELTKHDPNIGAHSQSAATTPSEAIPAPSLVLPPALRYSIVTMEMGATTARPRPLFAIYCGIASRLPHALIITISGGGEARPRQKENAE